MEVDWTYNIARVRAPELCAHKEFTRWMNLATHRGQDRVRLGNPGPYAATWHDAGPGGDAPLGEFSDLFVWKDSTRYDGSDTDMPEDVWNAIVDLVGEDWSGLIWISFEGGYVEGEYEVQDQDCEEPQFPSSR